MLKDYSPRMKIEVERLSIIVGNSRKYEVIIVREEIP
jgi:hypothetical protein